MSSAGRGGALRAVGLVLRVAAWALVALVVVDTFASGPVRSLLLPLNTQLGRAIPQQIAGTLVISTPLGGAFRGDFAILACGLLALDWALCRAADALR